jgi:hypothetical protein
MINFRRWRIATAAAILTVLAGSVAVPAAVARPVDPDGVPRHRITVSDSSLTCPLRRIDRQLVRCDNLTGAGVPAPLFIAKL